ncbi:MAG: reverse transcriptase, partial [Oscillospiraceae bacterium]|nr:reverse transcriptase [Oscillospiraceae bacterium]
MGITNYYDEAISFPSLYRALDDVCRGVRWKDSVTGYEHHGLENTLALRDSLANGTYKISRYQEFVIYEPKERRIVASRLVDRQVQRSLRNAGLYQDIVEHFIRDNLACQVGRGITDAHKRLKTHLRRYYNEHGAEGWVLKCDIKHFFPSTPHDTAKAAVNKYVSDPRAAKAVRDVIDSFGGDRGLGLGSEISQLVELLVLNDLDHYIKERLGARYYIRYMDDFIVIHPDKDYLRRCLVEIRGQVEAMGFALNKKTCIYPLRQGVKFLRWRYVVTGTGKVLMLLDKSKIHK